MIFLPTRRFSASANAAGGQPRTVLARVSHDLHENLLPFWAARCKDDQQGGYLTHFDLRGQPSAVTDKYAVMHARIAWFFSAAHRHGVTNVDCLALAKRGLDYLARTMWDEKSGGFCFSVRADGTPRDASKQLYVQCFAIYAFSEYAMASHDPSAIEWAEKAFQFIRSRYYKGAGGYRPMLACDSAQAAERQDDISSTDYLVHVMEAFTALVNASQKSEYRAALREVVRILVSRTLDSKYGCAIDLFDGEWRPWPSRRGHIVTRYGINAEFAWLLLDAAEALNEPPAQYESVVRRLMDYTLEYGFDGKRGGIAAYGPIGVRVGDAGFFSRRLVKEWWPQAEMLVALIEAYRLTRDPQYLAAFGRHFEWIWKHQIDHRDGEWFCNVNWSGTLVLATEKGSGWKGPYHNGRALMRVEKVLRELGLEDWLGSVPV